MSEEQLRAIVESAKDAVVFCDNQGRIEGWNAAAKCIFGYEPADVLGLPLETLLPKRLRGRPDSPIGRILAGADHLIGQTIDLLGVSKDGREFPVELYVSALFCESRRCYAAFISDVSQRKEVERALELEQAYFEELFHSTPEAIVLVDNESRILRHNDGFTRLFGYGPEEATGRIIDRLLTPHGALDESLELTRRAAAGEDISVEVVRQTRDGRRLDVSILAVPIHTVEGQVAILAIYRDITEEKRAAKSFLEMQKLDSLSLMAGGIAHDFNNLLVSVLGNAELALMELAPDDPVTQLVKSIQRSAKRASGLTNQMLAYSGKGKFQVVPLEPSALVEDLRNWLKVGRSSGAQVKYDLPPDLPQFEGDAAQVRQAITALFANALEALDGKPGSVTVSTGAEYLSRDMLSEAYLAEDLPEGMYAFIRVADDGSGMAEETRKRMFDPFFSTRFTGRGLGLPAALGVARGHNGTLHVDTELGAGTTVTMFFPVTDVDEASSEAKAATPVGQWTTEGTVLVADDDEAVRSVAKAILEKCGLDVVQASDGQMAVELFEQHSESIVVALIDFTMPGMDGDVVVSEIARFRSDVPVLLMSGYAEEDTAGELGEERISGFVHKPFHAATLVEKVREAIEH